MSDSAHEIELHNTAVYKQIDDLEQEIARLEIDRSKLEANIIPPCRLCPYDGV